MISADALNERMWGPFPALRELLESKQIPDQYYGLTSVSDNPFERVQRALKLAILIRHFGAEVVNATNDRAALRKDLERLADLLRHFQEDFGDAVNEVRGLQARV
jgi:hypothetical protein